MMLEWNRIAIYFARRVLQNLFDLCSQPCFQEFISIKLQHPFVRALRNRPVLLLGGLNVFVLQDVGVELTTDSDSIVVAKRVDDKDFVRPLDLFKLFANNIFIVVGWEQHREFSAHWNTLG